MDDLLSGAHVHPAVPVAVSARTTANSGSPRAGSAHSSSASSSPHTESTHPETNDAATARTAASSHGTLPRTESQHTVIDMAGEDNPATERIDAFARSACAVAAMISEFRRQCAPLGTARDSLAFRQSASQTASKIEEAVASAKASLHHAGNAAHMTDTERARLARLMADFHAQLAAFQTLERALLESSRSHEPSPQVSAPGGAGGAKAKSNKPGASRGPKSPSNTSPFSKQNRAAGNTPRTEDANPSAQKQATAQMLQETSEHYSAIILDRERGIQEIETTMAEVHDLLIDIGLVANEQQGLLDNIEASIEASAIRTRASVREVALMNQRQRRRRRRQMCFMIIAAVFVFILVMLVLYTI